MSLKEGLLTTALLGTENQALPIITTDDNLGTYFAELQKQVDKLSREHCVLHAAALLHLHSKAGMLLSKFEAELPAPAPEEELPPISRQACHQMVQMLEYKNELLSEWFELVVALGRIIPSSYIIPALQLGAEHYDMQELVKKSTGKRAAWLAQFNSDWHFVLNTEAELDWPKIEAQWATGSQYERETAILPARRADPSSAIELLASTWKEESTEQRVSFLECLATGLCSSDESFLEETALNDKRKEVRTVAVNLLLQIADSRLRNRARERAFACVKLTELAPPKNLAALLPGMKRKRVLELHCPDEADKAMIRDGLVAKSNDARLGEKAFLLKQVVSYVDPSEWCKAFQIDYDEFLAMVEKSDWKLAIMIGLEEASVTFSNAACAKAHLLLGSCEDPSGLASVLTDAEREAVLTLLLERNKFLPPSPRQQSEYLTVRAILDVMGRWSLAFSKTVLQVHRNYLRPRNADFFNIDYFLNATATRLDTRLMQEAQELYGTVGEGVPLVEKALDTLIFRTEMRETLMADADTVEVK